MDRLIYADVTIEALQNRIGESIKKCIDSVPTACDIEQIREEIAYNHDFYFISDTENGRDIALGLEYALDIIDEHLKGGKE